MATLQNFTIFRGEDALLTVTLDPVPTGGITGWTLAFYVRTRPEVGTSALLTVAGVITDADDAIFTVTIAGADSLLLPPGRYRYDIWRTGSGVQTLLTYGAMDVLPQARFTPL